MLKESCLELDKTVKNAIIVFPTQMNPKNKYATHCPQNHPYSPSNTYLDSNNSRRCRKCNRIRWRIKHNAKKEYNSFYKEK